MTDETILFTRFLLGWSIVSLTVAVSIIAEASSASISECLRFCVVVVYNNVLARLRRVSGSIYEASADLGAHGFFTFRTITAPVLSTALVSGALLAFALSFDEVVVTVFTSGAQNTLPIWIFGAIRLGQRLPEVNVVVSFVILVTIVPVVIAARLTGGGGASRVPAAR